MQFGPMYGGQMGSMSGYYYDSGYYQSQQQAVSSQAKQTGPTATVSSPPTVDAEPSTSQGTQSQSHSPIVTARETDPIPEKPGPASSSTPKKVDLPNYSPISEPEGNVDASKLDFIMPDHSTTASSVLASTVDNANSSETSIIPKSLKPKAQPAASSEASQLNQMSAHSGLITGSSDTSGDQQQGDIPLKDTNNNNKIDTSQHISMNAEKVNTSEFVQPEPPKVYQENLDKLPYLSSARRITLAYKYYPFSKKPVANNTPVSEARGSDEDETAPKQDEVLETSFPISSFITESWRAQGKSFKESLQKALVMDKSDPPENEADATDNKEAEDEDEDEFMVYSSSFGSILKSKPVKKQHAFHYNKEKFAPFVKLDGNITKLMRDDRKTWNLSLKLNADEIKHIQLAESYNLYAESHATAFCRSSRRAVNQVLSHLNPETQPDDVAALKDCKYMLKGMAMAIEQIVQNSIYVHAGLTAKLRSDFLQAQGNYLPLHVKQGLLHECFGGTGLFNSQIKKYVPDITAHNEKINQSKLTNAVVGKFKGYKIPRKSGSQDDDFQPGSSNDDQGTRGRGRGRGRNNNNRGRGAGRGQTKQYDDGKPQDHNNASNRGGKAKNKGRGKKSHN